MHPPVLHHLLRKTPTLAPITNRALISVSGRDANFFLNGLLSTQIRPPQFGAFLHAQGRLLYDIFIYLDPHSPKEPTIHSPSYLIEYSPLLDASSSSTPSSPSSPSTPSAPKPPPLLNYLKRHILRSKVKVREVSEEYDIWASWGSETDHSFERQRKQMLEEEKWKWAQSSGAVEPVWDDNHGHPWGMDRGEVWDRRGVGMGKRMVIRKGDQPKECVSHDIVTPDEYLLHRILHGVPEGPIDMPPMQAFPMDSDLDIMGGYFRKGCYVGQELTVRTYHTGMIRKRIHPVILHSPSSSTPSSSSSSPSLPTPLTFTQPLPYDVDIKPISISIPTPLPSNPLDPTIVPVTRARLRGTGKLLSTSPEGVGLALLRLEHMRSALNGEVKFEMDLNADAIDADVDTIDKNVEGRLCKVGVTPWVPEWWPSGVDDVR